jgi:U3 small nucleolar RNA-associated protein 3
MDLALGGESSSSSSSSEETDEESVNEEGEDVRSGASEEEEELSSSSDEDEEEEDGEAVRDWGRKKSSYYHGDTADLEIGQDEEDAFIEEEAAKEVQAARYKEMAEDDFVLSDAEEGENGAAEATMEVAERDISKLTTKDKRKLLERQHPELLPLLAHFSNIVEDLDQVTSVATRAMFDGEEGIAEVGCFLVC